MDNYSLEDVIKIDKNGLLTPKVLKKIILSVVRRVEIYGDYTEVEILRYLKTSNSVEEDLIKEIDDYIYKFEGHIIEEEKVDKRRVILTLPLILIVVLIYLLLR